MTKDCIFYVICNNKKTVRCKDNQQYDKCKIYKHLYKLLKDIVRTEVYKQFKID